MTDKLWKKGPSWLSSSSDWPPDKRLKASPESKAEAKLTKQILSVAITEPVSDELLDKYPLPKLLRIGAWMYRFIANGKKDSRERDVGPIKTSTIKQQQFWWTRRVQKEAEGDAHFQIDQIQLNLQSNDEQVL